VPTSEQLIKSLAFDQSQAMAAMEIPNGANIASQSIVAGSQARFLPSGFPQLRLHAEQGVVRNQDCNVPTRFSDLKRFN